MAKVTYIPSKPEKGRVQLSSNELALLLGLVWDQVKGKQAGDQGVQSLGALLVKLGRAYKRVSADSVT